MDYPNDTLVNEIVGLIDSPLEMTRDEAFAEVANLRRMLEIVQKDKSSFYRQLLEIQTQVRNVRGHIEDIYSMNGEIDEDIKAIAELLDITLTKKISGEATFTISFTVDIPLGMDPDDFELSFDVDCDTYEADNFDWCEENTEVNAEEV